MDVIVKHISGEEKRFDSMVRASLYIDYGSRYIGQCKAKGIYESGDKQWTWRFVGEHDGLASKCFDCFNYFDCRHKQFGKLDVPECVTAHKIKDKISEYTGEPYQSLQVIRCKNFKDGSDSTIKERKERRRKLDGQARKY